MPIDWEKVAGAPCVAVFGEAEGALYIPADVSIAPYSVIPVFDEEYREVILLDAAAPTSDAMPVVGINDSQFKARPVQGDRIKINRTAVTYIVKEPRPDGHGITKLMLNETDPYAP